MLKIRKDIISKKLCSSNIVIHSHETAVILQLSGGCLLYSELAPCLLDSPHYHCLIYSFISLACKYHGLQLLIFTIILQKIFCLSQIHLVVIIPISMLFYPGLSTPNASYNIYHHFNTLCNFSSFNIFYNAFYPHGLCLLWALTFFCMQNLLLKTMSKIPNVLCMVYFPKYIINYLRNETITFISL